MIKRKTKRRTFTLQLYDRIEPLDLELFDDGRLPTESRLPGHVQAVLRGHTLGCPRCSQEPECGQMSHHPIYGIMIEAHCTECNINMEFDIDPNGEPHMTNPVMRHG